MAKDQRDDRARAADDERETGADAAAGLALEADLTEDPRGAAGWLDALHDERNDAIEALGWWQASITDEHDQPADPAIIRAAFPTARPAWDGAEDDGVWFVPLTPEQEAELQEDGSVAFNEPNPATPPAMLVWVEMP